MRTYTGSPANPGCATTACAAITAPPTGSSPVGPLQQQRASAGTCSLLAVPAMLLHELQRKPAGSLALWQHNGIEEEAVLQRRIGLDRTAVGSDDGPSPPAALARARRN